MVVGSALQNIYCVTDYDKITRSGVVVLKISRAKSSNFLIDSCKFSTFQEIMGARNFSFGPKFYPQ